MSEMSMSGADCKLHERFVGASVSQAHKEACLA